MASRRVRIKGIANIPQRRKNDAFSNIEEDNNSQLETDKVCSSSSERRKSIDNNGSESNNNETTSKSYAEETKHSQIRSKPFVKPSDMAAILKPKKVNLNDCANVKSCSPAPASPNNGSSHETARLIEKTSNSGVLDGDSSLKLLNRSRIKAVPNLDGRRISVHGSASESEDETKRNHVNRVRTDSVCTISSSTVDDTYFCAPRVRQYSSLIQRKCRRSEQSRKMAEARREFAQKFGHDNPPEKSKLTMMDLIFYNPSSNPMSKRTTSEPSSSSRKIVEIDEPSTEISYKSDTSEENALLVPQIKVGPDGNIILDEQSLVINQTSSRDQDILDTPIVDGNSESAYGVYKKAKRSKDWTHAETVRFYRALNTIGTDFSIMGHLFPRRTRRELKMKFKKEERLNQELVDRALKLPLNFDITSLKTDMEEDERQHREEEERKASKRKLQEERRLNSPIKRLRRQKLSQLSKEINIGRSRANSSRASPQVHGKDLKNTGEQAESSEDEDIKVVMLRSKCKEKMNVDEKFLDKENKKVKRRVMRPANNKLTDKGFTGSVSTSSDDDDDDDEDMELPILRPTRSGRIPKPRILDIPSYDSLSSNIVATKPAAKPPQIPNLLPHGINQVPPGSIIVVSSQDANGLPIYKVFVMTPQQQKIPLSLSTDKMESLTNNLGQAIHITLPTVTSQNVPQEEPLPPENNYTIAEEELVLVEPELDATPLAHNENKDNECLKGGIPEPYSFVTVTTGNNNEKTRVHDI